jgi:hypothetical protein
MQQQQQQQQQQQPFFGDEAPPEDFICVRFMNGRSVNVTREVMEQKDGTNSNKVTARRTQFPLKLAWAMSKFFRPYHITPPRFRRHVVLSLPCFFYFYFYW